MQDDELVELIKSDPNKGLGILMKEYMGLVCTIVRERLYKVCDNFEMEACAGDIFIEFYNGIDSYTSERGSVKAYICVIAKRRSIDIFRKKSREFGSISIDDEEAGIDIQSNSNIEKEYEVKEQKKELLEAIDNLGEPDREIIVRKYYLGESTRQIADRLAMTTSAVDTRNSRALKKLRKVLQGITLR